MFTTRSSNVAVASSMGARGVGHGYYVGLSSHLLVVASQEIFLLIGPICCLRATATIEVSGQHSRFHIFP